MTHAPKQPMDPHRADPTSTSGEGHDGGYEVNRLRRHLKLATPFLALVLVACAPTSMDPASINAILFGATALKTVLDAAAAENRAALPQPVGSPAGGYGGDGRAASGGATAAGCISVTNVTTPQGYERIRFVNTCPYTVNVAYDWRRTDGTVHNANIRLCQAGGDGSRFLPRCDIGFHFQSGPGVQLVGHVLECRGGFDPGGTGTGLGTPLPLVNDGWSCMTNVSRR